MDQKKLKKARDKIDKVDRKIFYLIKKRTKIVKQLLSIKKLKSQIIDHKRINKILRNIRSKSIRNNVDPKITSQIWKAMIWSYVDFQRKNFKKK